MITTAYSVIRVIAAKFQLLTAYAALEAITGEMVDSLNY